MKQAYTNTIRGGGSRNPLTIPTGSRRGGSSTGSGSGGRQHHNAAPKCAYGAACTRRGCAYRHPDPSDARCYDSYHEDP